MPEVDLGEYEGKPIRKMAIEVRNTSGGLNAAMKVRPDRIHPGEKRFVVYEVTFDKFRFDPMDEGDAWTLVPIGHAETAAFLDEAVVKDALDAARAAAIALADEKAGRSQITDEELIETAHLNGAHKRARKGCRLCEEAVAAKAAAKAEKAAKATKPRGRGKLQSV